jgi:hypothetical protein
VHATVCLDGNDLPQMADRPSKFLFSPDSKTFAFFGRTGAARGLYFDGDLVIAGAENAERPVFTADSKHFLWLGKHGDPRMSPEPYAAYVDGRLAVMFRELINTRDNWELSAAGVLTFVARTGDALKRFRITPSTAAGVTAMKAAAKAGRAPNLADLTPMPSAVADLPPPVATTSPANATGPSPAAPGAPATTPSPAAAPGPTTAPDPVSDAAKKATDVIDATKSLFDVFRKKKS